MTVGIIVAMNADRIIGVNGSIPWKYSADMKRFKAVTMGSTVIMGRKTWESIPTKFRPLTGRENVVITSKQPGTFGHDGVGRYHFARSVSDALTELPKWFVALDGNDVWFIGGARIYAEAMQYADVIDVTWVPWRRPCMCGCPASDHDQLPEGAHGPEDYEPEALHKIDCTLFPPIDETVFAPGPREPHPDDPALALQRFTRIKLQV